MDHHDHNDEPLILKLRAIIRFAVRVLALIMTAVILWGVVDVCWVLYQELISPPRFLLTISDILATFGAFMAVLIAIEIFVNICIYLEGRCDPCPDCHGNRLMAIARKVIILDFNKTSPEYVWAIAGVVFAMSIGYFLVFNSSQTCIAMFDPIFPKDHHEVHKAEKPE
jgi:Phosphate-starvation-inducible E.